jgi:hypothetical protein
VVSFTAISGGYLRRDQQIWSIGLWRDLPPGAIATNVVSRVAIDED